MMFLKPIISQNHKIVEWPGLKRTTMIIEFQPPCYVQGRRPPDQAAQSHIQPGLECLQGWYIHNLLGQPVQCITTLCVKNFLLIYNLNLPCLRLRPFPLVLSLSIPVNSHSPSCLYAPFMKKLYQIKWILRTINIVRHLELLCATLKPFGYVFTSPRQSMSTWFVDHVNIKAIDSC